MIRIELTAIVINLTLAKLFIEGEATVAAFRDSASYPVSKQRVLHNAFGGFIDLNPYLLIQSAEVSPAVNSDFSLVFTPQQPVLVGEHYCVGFIFDVASEISNLRCQSSSLLLPSMPTACSARSSAFSGVAVTRFLISSASVTTCTFTASETPAIFDPPQFSEPPAGLQCHVVRQDLAFRSPSASEVLAHGNSVKISALPSGQYEAYCVDEQSKVSVYKFPISRISEIGILSFTGALNREATELAVSLLLIPEESPVTVRCIAWWAADSTTSFQVPEVIDPLTLKPKAANYTVVEAASGGDFWTRFAAQKKQRTVQEQMHLTFFFGDLTIDSKYWIICGLRADGRDLRTVATVYTGSTVGSLSTVGNFLARRVEGGGIIAGIIDFSFAEAGSIQCENLASVGIFEGPRIGVLNFTGQWVIGTSGEVFLGKQLVGVREDQQISWCRVAAQTAATGISISEVQTSYKEVSFVVANLAVAGTAAVACDALPWTPRNAPAVVPTVTNGTYTDFAPVPINTKRLWNLTGLDSGLVYEVFCVVQDAGAFSLFAQQTVHTNGARTPVDGFWTCEGTCIIGLQGFELSGRGRVQVKRTPEACACACISECSTEPIFGLSVTYALEGGAWCFIDPEESSCQDIQAQPATGKYVSQQACENLGLSQTSNAIGTSLSLGSVAALSGGTYALCYDARGIGDFSMFLGDLFIRGTWPCESFGENCTFEIFRYPIEEATDRLIVRRTDCECFCVSQCSTAVVSGILKLPKPWCYIRTRTSCPDALLEFSTRKYVSQSACSSVSGIGDEDRGISFPISNKLVTFGSNAIYGEIFFMCHCVYPCSLYTQLKRKVGSLLLRGPTTVQTQETVDCVAGKICQVQLTSIISGSPGDRLTICTFSDRESVASLPTADGRTFRWVVPWERQMSESLSLCWCGAKFCGSYAVNSGRLRLLGPIMNSSQVAYCFVGRNCTVNIAGVNLSSTSDRLVLRVQEENTVDTCRRVRISQPAIYGANVGAGQFSFSAMSFGGASGLLCWCREPCVSLSAYTVTAMTFKLVGPRYSVSECYKGKLCTLRVAGYLTDDNKRFILVDGDCGSGSSLTGQSRTAHLLPGDPAADIHNYEVSWTTEIQAPAGTYNLCWRESASSSFNVKTGDIKVRGPLVTDTVFRCKAFVDCVIVIDGTHLDSAEDRLIVSPSCGASLSLTTLTQVKWGTDRQVAYSIPGLTPRVANLCWCGGPSCATSSDAASFKVHAGVLLIAGVFPVQSTTCYEGLECKIRLKGIDFLSDANFETTKIATGTYCQPDSSGIYSNIVDSQVVENETLQGNLGKLILFPDNLLQPEAPFSVPVCWCISQGTCKPAGTLNVRTYEEYYRTFVDTEWSAKSRTVLISSLAVGIPALFVILVAWKLGRKKFAELLSKRVDLVKPEDDVLEYDTKKNKILSTERSEDAKLDQNDEERRMHKELMSQRSQIAASLFYKKVEAEVDPEIEVRITTRKREVSEDEFPPVLKLEPRAISEPRPVSQERIISPSRAPEPSQQATSLNRQNTWSVRKQNLKTQVPFAIEDDN